MFTNISEVLKMEAASTSHISKLLPIYTTAQKIAIFILDGVRTRNLSSWFIIFSNDIIMSYVLPTGRKHGAVATETRIIISQELKWTVSLILCYEYYFLSMFQIFISEFQYFHRLLISICKKNVYIYVLPPQFRIWIKFTTKFISAPSTSPTTHK